MEDTEVYISDSPDHSAQPREHEDPMTDIDDALEDQPVYDSRATEILVVDDSIEGDQPVDNRANAIEADQPVVDNAVEADQSVASEADVVVAAGHDVGMGVIDADTEAALGELRALVQEHQTEDRFGAELDEIRGMIADALIDDLSDID